MLDIHCFSFILDTLLYSASSEPDDTYDDVATVHNVCRNDNSFMLEKNPAYDSLKINN